MLVIYVSSAILVICVLASKKVVRDSEMLHTRRNQNLDDDSMRASVNWPMSDLYRKSMERMSKTV